MKLSRIVPSIILALSVASAPVARAQTPDIPHPTDYFGFEIGADGELARYPRILEYLRLLGDRSNRFTYERRTSTLGNPYVLATISAPRNLARFDRLVEINHRLNDPRGLSEADALALAREGVPFYFLYATIHATEVGTTQAVIRLAHRLATEQSPEAAEILRTVSRETGLPAHGADVASPVPGFRLRSPTRVGLWRAANNMPGGWMRWQFEQYELGHVEVSSLDFEGDLEDRYDVIVLPSGTTRRRIVDGLDPERHDESWLWAFGVGDARWRKLADWVKSGGTLRDAFQSPVRLLDTLCDQVVEPTALFYGPGSLLKQEFDPRHPVAFGTPRRWPVFVRFDPAYRLTPSFDIRPTASRYPTRPTWWPAAGCSGTSCCGTGRTSWRSTSERARR